MLSDHERQQLAEIEANLYRDVKFVKTYRKTHQPRFAARIIMVFAILVGLMLLIIGVRQNNAAIGVAGYISMLTGAVIGYKNPDIRLSPDVEGAER